MVFGEHKSSSKAWRSQGFTGHENDSVATTVKNGGQCDDEVYVSTWLSHKSPRTWSNINLDVLDNFGEINI